MKIQLYWYVSGLILLLILIPTLMEIPLTPVDVLAGPLPPTAVRTPVPGRIPIETAQPTTASTVNFDDFATPKIYIPIIQRVTTVRAMRLDFPDYADSRELVISLERQMKAIGVNMVALGAGRVEWTFFKWTGQEDSWSNDVRDTGIDFLLDDSTRFGKWAHTNAVVDVFAPNYILAHPDKAAIAVDGVRSQNLVSFTELVHGEFGQKLLAMIEYIAANYPVDSISITELFYHRDGYGPDDKAAYMAYTGKNDWPRFPDGTINTFDPSVGNWRSQEMDLFLDKAVALAHKHGKQLFMDVELSLEDLSLITNEHGTNYDLVLEHMDRIIVWGYFGVDHYAPEYLSEVAQFLTRYSPNRLVLSVGLWGDGGGAVSPESFQTALQSIKGGGIQNLWITPSLLMNETHWQILRDFWGGK